MFKPFNAKIERSKAGGGGGPRESSTAQKEEKGNKNSEEKLREKRKELAEVGERERERGGRIGMKKGGNLGGAERSLSLSYARVHFLANEDKKRKVNNVRKISSVPLTEFGVSGTTRLAERERERERETTRIRLRRTYAWPEVQTESE